MEFIRFASNLKVIQIHSFDFKITQEFILDIFEILKSTREEMDILPLKLFIYHYGKIDLATYQMLDIKNYLCVTFVSSEVVVETIFDFCCFMAGFMTHSSRIQLIIGIISSIVELMQ